MRPMAPAVPTKANCLKVSGPTIFASCSMNCGTLNLMFCFFNFIINAAKQQIRGIKKETI